MLRPISSAIHPPSSPSSFNPILPRDSVPSSSSWILPARGASACPSSRPPEGPGSLPLNQIKNTIRENLEPVPAKLLDKFDCHSYIKLSSLLQNISSTSNYLQYIKYHYYLKLSPMQKKKLPEVPQKISNTSNY